MKEHRKRGRQGACGRIWGEDNTGDATPCKIAGDTHRKLLRRYKVWCFGSHARDLDLVFGYFYRYLFIHHIALNKPIGFVFLWSVALSIIIVNSEISQCHCYQNFSTYRNSSSRRLPKLIAIRAAKLPSPRPHTQITSTIAVTSTNLKAAPTRNFELTRLLNSHPGRKLCVTDRTCAKGCHRRGSQMLLRLGRNMSMCS